jgi:hypothetical protein
MAWGVEYLNASGFSKPLMIHSHSHSRTEALLSSSIDSIQRAFAFDFLVLAMILWVINNTFESELE